MRGKENRDKRKTKRKRSKRSGINIIWDVGRERKWQAGRGRKEEGRRGTEGMQGGKEWNERMKENGRKGNMGRRNVGCLQWTSWWRSWRGR